MDRRVGLMVSLGVACALATTTFVLAQEKKAAPAAAAEEVVVKKALEAMKREAVEKVKEQDVRIQKIRVMPAPAPVGGMILNPVGVNNVNMALLQQFTQQFRGILRAEYELLVSVCAPNRRNSASRSPAPGSRASRTPR